MKSKHILVVSYDGVCTHYCGVGTIIRNTVESLTDLSKIYKFKVSIAYISVDPRSIIFNTDCFEESKKLTDLTGGYLIPLSNGTEGKTEWDMWSRFNEWKTSCASLATAVNLIFNDEDENIIMMHDTPFLFFQDFKKQIFNKHYRSYYLPHSSGINHSFGDIEWRTERIDNEKRLFTDIISDENSYLIAEGNNFAEHLIKDYDIDHNKIGYLTNGLYFERYKNDLDREVIYKDLEELNLVVPNEYKVIFSWGRCSIAKGFKELVLAWEKIYEKLPNYYLIIQSPDNSGENDYYKILESFSKRLPRLIIINDYNPKIWKSFLRYKNTEVVVIPSVMDPNPHTAIEAKLFNQNSKYVIVASNTDGVKDSYNDNECIYTDPYNVSDFSNALLKATSLDLKTRNSMIDENRKNLSKYDYKLKLETFFKNINFL